MGTTLICEYNVYIAFETVPEFGRETLCGQSLLSIFQESQKKNMLLVMFFVLSAKSQIQ
jgi:hypothetical protein